MTAHVSYLGLMEVQRRPLRGTVAPPAMTVKEMLEGTKAARKALGLAQRPGIVKAHLVPRDVAKKVAEAVMPAPVEPPPVIFVVQQQELDDADDRSPIIPLPRWKSIVREVSEKHGVPIIDILSDRRNVPFVRARHECFFRLSKETTLSLPQIGKRLGGKDHTTVLAGIRRHQERMRAGV